MSRVLVTGASGFVGKRLVIQLLEKGHTVYALSRIKGRSVSLKHPNLREIFGDLKDSSLVFSKEIEVAYYLIHSMSEEGIDLLETERKTAKHFVQAVDQTNCVQIIYLGGLIEEGRLLSLHLASRLNVEEVLKKSKCEVTIFRSSVIIGAGSASFEIIQDLSEKLPVMIAPKWVKSLCQPISAVDVLYYLSHALLEKKLYGKTFDIGGPEVMSFKEVLLRYARFRGLKRWIIDVPLLTPRLSSYWLFFVTSVRFSLCSYLVDSMKYNSICRDHSIEDRLPHKCAFFEEALTLAFLDLSQNKVASTWMDSWSIKASSPDITQYSQVPKEGCLKDEQRVSLRVPKEEVIARIWSIGGENGWYGFNWAWKIRGFLDKVAGGTGLNRGRRDRAKVNVGDSIDFWRVVKADLETGHLILYAEMKLPGEAWLEFKIENNILCQTATFRPQGILGKCYWFAMLPFHLLIFRKMAESLVEKKKTQKLP